VIEVIFLLGVEGREAANLNFLGLYNTAMKQHIDDIPAKAVAGDR